MIKTKVYALVAVFSLSIIASGCQSWSGTAKGGAIGAGSGAVLGGVIGKKSGNTAAGAVLGGVIGGVAGAAIGKVMDKQKKEIEEDLELSGEGDEEITVERIGGEEEGTDEGLNIRFESGILFKVNSSDLSTVAKENLGKVAQTFQKYPDTDIVIEGHTDSSGSDAHNQKLSERRASSVSNHLISLGVSRERLLTRGYGETKPIADNATAEGKKHNRRVEILVFPNEKMKKDAEEGKLNTDG